MPASDSLIDVPRVVLDTNVLLDWLVFANPGVHAVMGAVQAGDVRWIACAAMRAELVHVLTDGALRGRLHDLQLALGRLDSLCSGVPLDAGALPLRRPRCTDPSDQVFVDLALQHGASALLTHDRALLKLARKLAPYGIQVLPPERWPA